MLAGKDLATILTLILSLSNSCELDNEIFGSFLNELQRLTPNPQPLTPIAVGTGRLGHESLSILVASLLKS